MALTRKMLSAMDIPAEKIEEIINLHSETVNEIKAERDSYKAKAEAAEKNEKELKDAQAEIEKIKSGDWENKYNTIKKEYDAYKGDVEAKVTKATKEKAYRELLAQAGVSAKRIDSVVKVSGSSIDAIVFDKDGKITDADKMIESVKTEWADFITTQQEQGAKVSNPPANNGGEVKKPNSRAEELVAKYRNEHYGNPNKED